MLVSLLPYRITNDKCDPLENQYKCHILNSDIYHSKQVHMHDKEMWISNMILGLIFQSPVTNNYGKFEWRDII